MPKGGWYHLNKRCPNKRCDGELFAKDAVAEMSGTVSHTAVKCSKGDFEKRDRHKPMLAWIRKQAEKREDDDD
jgi:hypothetical protein